MFNRYAGALIAVVTIFFMASYSHAEILLDRVVAVVNQEVITWSELYRNMEIDASPQLKALKDEERRKIFRENEASFLESLINLKLQLQEAAALGMNVGDDEVKEGIDSVKKKYGMTDEQFKESLKKEGFTYEEYRRRFREQIIISKVVSNQVRSKVLVTDSEMKQYIADAVAKGENLDGYRISQIFFRKPRNEEGRRPLEEKAEDIVRRLGAGENFVDLAKKFSEDASASAGGDIGLIKKNLLLKEFSEALAGMKPGEVSKPFWTERGLHIIKLNEKTDPKDPKELQEEARKAITEKLSAERYNAWIKSLREKAFIEIRL